MIHKIKGLYDNGQGLSIRRISHELQISRQTVRKYLKMDEQTINDTLSDPSRTKRLDDYRDYLIHQLKSYPKLSAVKLARRLQARIGELPASNRSIRRYVRTLKQEVATGQWRYYEPILEMAPGVQCQIDPGELRGVWINGREETVYVVVFILSYSRLMYVGVSFQPINTETFIQLHDEAFRYFGGVPEECVYDQTRLVVIDECYRELTLNQRFHHYATTAGFRVHACEGYDPESKGKVEAGVKYVKNDGLYGEHFSSETALRAHLQEWQESVANVRCHGTTGRLPREHFDSEEYQHLSPYLVPQQVLSLAPSLAHRWVDKTGLIAWHSNKYSVPMAWQQARVGVSEADGTLFVYDLESGQAIAQHPLQTDKGQIIKNRTHYRDPGQRIADWEEKITTLCGPDQGETLCRLLKYSGPRIYKDQLVAAYQLLQQYAAIAPEELTHILARPTLTARQLQEQLEARQQARTRQRLPETQHLTADAQMAPSALSAYAPLVYSTGQEVPHERA